LFLELRREPVEALHEPVPRGGTGRLDVPVPALGNLREGGREGRRRTGRESGKCERRKARYVASPH